MTSPSSNLAATYWSDDEPLECVAVVPEAANTVSFSFRAPSDALFHYKAGQFVTLELPTANGLLYRTYTISSAPTRPNVISLTVKAQADSVGSRWLIDHLTPGMSIKAIGPAGRFTNADSNAKKFLFISAGSGVTPMMSMTTAMCDKGKSLDTVFIHCARRPSDILFRQRLEDMASREPSFNLKFTVEEPDANQAWTGYQGRFNAAMLQLMATDFFERDVYCCGPEPFMQSVKTILLEFGFNMHHYYEESFAPSRAETIAVPPVSTSGTPLVCDVHFSLSNRHQACSPEDSLLLTAQAAGIVIPSACTFGVCGTCKIKKLEGEVEMHHSGGITQEDIDDNYVLACCSYPRGKVSLRI